MKLQDARKKSAPGCHSGPGDCGTGAKSLRPRFRRAASDCTGSNRGEESTAGLGVECKSCGRRDGISNVSCRVRCPWRTDLANGLPDD
ncbi:hypothetical protein EJ03DRAFT_97280 [Teratosphaeria nubilosa]|uniref:Uncharacterized protein n=1 Tax=Teratosphaeria nubilosa TaxID=161662 RepID=A0A6G1L9B9_9PEZI|nr:hypothetical protein EJ03DRAFT_97280 [Teratosphaeria nubilosa]